MGERKESLPLNILAIHLYRSRGWCLECQLHDLTFCKDNPHQTHKSPLKQAKHQVCPPWLADLSVFPRKLLLSSFRSLPLRQIRVLQNGALQCNLRYILHRYSRDPSTSRYNLVCKYGRPLRSKYISGDSDF